jgi:antitoxin component of MazEF toxin-antitoxin module
MIVCTLEQIGDRVALILTRDAVDALHLAIGDSVRLEIGDDGVLHVAARETGADDVHARGRAFLKRYRRTFEHLS